MLRQTKKLDEYNRSRGNSRKVLKQKKAPKGRGDTRPVWELFYNHYVLLKGLKAPYVTAAAEKVRPEGGGGNYGPNSGGYDQLGYGTLTYTLKAKP